MKRSLLTIGFIFQLFMIGNTIDIMINTQMEFNTYIDGLTNNTIPADHVVMILFSTARLEANKTLINRGIIESNNNFEIRENALLINRGIINFGDVAFDIYENGTLENFGQFNGTNTSFLIDNGGIVNNYGSITIEAANGDFDNDGIVTNCSTINLDLAGGTAFSNGGIFYTRELVEDGNNSGNPQIVTSEFCPAIPTLSQWGIMALSIIMLILGLVFIRQRKVIFG